MRSRVLGTATLILAVQLLAAMSASAQGPQPGAPPAFSGIARNIATWWHHVSRTGTHRHRAASPPLPRPRPTQLTKSKELPATAEPNEALPAATVVEPNKISPASAPTRAPDKTPADLPAAIVEPDEGLAGTANTAAEQNRSPVEIEPHEAQPATSVIEPHMTSQTTTLAPDATPAELPPGAEQTSAPDTPTGAVLEKANIPD